VRRLPTTAPVRAPDTDDDVLRATASCAHEAMDALDLPAAQVPAAVQRVAQRYARALGIGLKELQAALQGRMSRPEMEHDAEPHSTDEDNPPMRTLA
jgi:non-specific serine/threonine protein kinase